MLNASNSKRDSKFVCAMICAGAVVLAAAVISPASAGGMRNVSVVNGTRNAMVSLQIRPSGSNAWQPDVLGARPLGVQKQIPVNVPNGGSCYYDVVSRFEDGHRQTKMHVDLCKSPNFTVTNF